MHRVYSNDDDGVIQLTLTQSGKPLTEELCRSYIHMYRGTGLSDLLLNINCQLSMTPSEVWETAAERSKSTELYGEPVDFRGDPGETVRLLLEAGIDLHAVLIDECYREGIRPWLSFRMNDVHNNRRVSSNGGTVQSDYTHFARERGLTRTNHRECVGYYDDALNYALPEVRRHFLDYIREQILRYPAAGIELDFSREFLCFTPGLEEEGRPLMREFFREVRAIADEAGRRHGHRVEVMARALSRPLDDLRSGLDIAGAAREGLLDVVIPTAHFGTTDDGCPVEQWRMLLPPGCRLAVGIETDILPGAGKSRQPRPAEMLWGLAHTFLSEGADDVYLFNELYHHRLGDDLVPLLFPLADRARLRAARRRMPVSYANIVAPGEPQPRRLPMYIKSYHWGGSEYADLRFYVGENRGDPLYMLLSINEEPERLSLYVNGRTVEYLGKCRLPEHSELDLLVFRVPPLSGNGRALEIRALDRSSTCNPVIDYAEMRNYPPNLL